MQGLSAKNHTSHFCYPFFYITYLYKNIKKLKITISRHDFYLASTWERKLEAVTYLILNLSSEQKKQILERESFYRSGTSNLLVANIYRLKKLKLKN